jgi:hypothetical protein
MVNYSESVLTSHILLLKPAFTELVALGIKKASGEVFQVNGFHIEIQNIEMKDCHLISASIEQSFLINAHIEKPRGWMPLKVDTQVLTRLTWAIDDENGYPTIKILNMDISSAQSTRLDIFNINIGLPAGIQHKILDTLSDKKVEIEQIINGLIKKQCQFQLSKSHCFKLPSNKAGVNSLYLRIKKYSWFAEATQDAIKTGVQIQTEVRVEQFSSKNNEFYISQSDKFPLEHSSLIQCNISYQMMADFLIGTKFPLGKKGEMEIVTAEMAAVDENSASIQLAFKGNLKGVLRFNMRLQFAKEVLVDLSELKLDLENKLLDFGAILFESTLEKRIQLEMTASINRTLANVIQQLNDAIASQREFIKLEQDELSLDKMEIDVLWRDDHAVLTAKCNYLSQVTISKVPPGLSGTHLQAAPI